MLTLIIFINNFIREQRKLDGNLGFSRFLISSFFAKPGTRTFIYYANYCRFDKSIKNTRAYIWSSIFASSSSPRFNRINIPAREQRVKRAVYICDYVHARIVCESQLYIHTYTVVVYVAYTYARHMNPSIRHPPFDRISLKAIMALFVRAHVHPRTIRLLLDIDRWNDIYARTLWYLILIIPFGFPLYTTLTVVALCHY